MRQVGIATRGPGLAPYRRIMTRVKRLDGNYLVECEDCGVLACTMFENNAKLLAKHHMLKH